MGVVFYDVPLNHANTTDATNEVQDIVTSSTVELEQQVCSTLIGQKLIDIIIIG